MTSASTLDYINGWLVESDASQGETVSFHLEVGCRWLGCLVELEDYMRCFPWKAVQAVHDRRWESLLQNMRNEWNFIFFLDGLAPNSPVYKATRVTRLPVFRELFLQAEPLVCV